MFSKVHHVGYLVPNLDSAIAWYVETLGAKYTGRGAVAGLGEVGFVQVGDVEVEFIEPEDRAQLGGGSGHLFHHVGYVVDDLEQAMADLEARGCRFATEAPFTNFMGYRLIYLDPAGTAGTRIHLTDASSQQSAVSRQGMGGG